MVMEFFHTPQSALHAAAERIQSDLEPDELPPLPSKWQRLSLTATDIAYHNDPIGADVIKTADDTACTIVSKHPELVCGDPNTAPYINQSYIAPQTGNLAYVIDKQGPIEPQKNWTGCGDPIVQNPPGDGYGTNVPVCNPDTGEQAVSSKGDLLYVPIYSATTNEQAQPVITSALQQVKADPSLGANTTTDPSQTKGTIYRYGNGVPTSDQTSDGLGAGSGLAYTTKNYSPEQGYSISVTQVEASSTSDITAYITVTVTNWYVRFLGFFVRYLDSDGNTIPISALSDDIKDQLASEFPLRGPAGVSNLWDTSDDLFLDLLGPEKEVLGIPTSSQVKTLVLPMPDEATSLLVFASGMGSTSHSANPYNGTTTPGATMTGLFNLSLPTFFLALNAASGVAGMMDGLEETSQVLSIVLLALTIFADLFETIGFADPTAFEDVGVSVGEMLLSSAATNLVKFVVSYLTAGETEQDLPATPTATASRTASGVDCPWSSPAPIPAVVASPLPTAFKASTAGSVKRRTAVSNSRH